MRSPKLSMRGSSFKYQFSDAIFVSLEIDLLVLDLFLVICCLNGSFFVTLTLLIFFDPHTDHNWLEKTPAKSPHDLPPQKTLPQIIQKPPLPSNQLALTTIPAAVHVALESGGQRDASFANSQHPQDGINSLANRKNGLINNYVHIIGCSCRSDPPEAACC